MAAPFTAGVATLVRARDATLTAAQVTDRVVVTAMAIGGPTPPRIDAAASVGQ